MRRSLLGATIALASIASTSASSQTTGTPMSGGANQPSTVRRQASAPGQSVSDAFYLFKISRHLRTDPPTETEYAELRALTDPAERQRFLDRKMDEYMASPLHGDRMVFRLSERFQLRTPALNLNSYLEMPASSQVYASQYPQSDSLTDLFRRLATQNLSWDALLTGKSYLIFQDPSSNSPLDANDVDFFKAVLPELRRPRAPRTAIDPAKPLPRLQGRPISFAADDPRVAGALTTPRFLSRFSTTNINKNRRRAAAVFRLFLCDPMVPVIPPSPDRKKELLPHSFDDSFQVTTEAALRYAMSRNADPHGTDERCMACHFKLDPMGLTFVNTGNVLHPEPAPGALIFRRAGGAVVNKAVSGLGELGAEIVKQPEYSSCQVEWFWNEFIGRDVPLSAQRKSELVAEFDRVGRRTNDFIKVLLKSPEFRTRPVSNDAITHTQVLPLLQRCDRCHANQGMQLFEDLTKGGGGAEAQRWLGKMYFNLTLPDTHRDKMPEDWRTWDARDLERLKRWLETGARDARGTQQIDPSTLRRGDQ